MLACAGVVPRELTAPNRFSCKLSLSMAYETTAPSCAPWKLSISLTAYSRVCAGLATSEVARSRSRRVILDFNEPYPRAPGHRASVVQEERNARRGKCKCRHRVLTDGGHAGRQSRAVQLRLQLSDKGIEGIKTLDGGRCGMTDRKQRV